MTTKNLLLINGIIIVMLLIGILILLAILVFQGRGDADSFVELPTLAEMASDNNDDRFNISIPQSETLTPTAYIEINEYTELDKIHTRAAIFEVNGTIYRVPDECAGQRIVDCTVPTIEAIESTLYSIGALDSTAHYLYRHTQAARLTQQTNGEFRGVIYRTENGIPVHPCVMVHVNEVDGTPCPTRTVSPPNLTLTAESSD